MIFVMSAVVTERKGKDAKITKEKLQPFEKAKAKPAMVMEKARMIVPIFSPRAFYIARVSFPSLEESSEGLMVSYQALSCLSRDSKYLTLTVLAILSLNIRSKA
jgi:hypothetical protein